VKYRAYPVYKTLTPWQKMILLHCSFSQHSLEAVVGPRRQRSPSHHDDHMEPRTYKPCAFCLHFGLFSGRGRWLFPVLPLWRINPRFQVACAPRTFSIHVGRQIWQFLEEELLSSTLQLQLAPSVNNLTFRKRSAAGNRQHTSKRTYWFESVLIFGSIFSSISILPECSLQVHFIPFGCSFCQQLKRYLTIFMTWLGVAPSTRCSLNS
jgi:hypothetical protein